eukprot:5641606-Lingulodinium_polyedra.AAC.1
MRGAGLSVFVAREGSGAPESLLDLPVLALHYDEGSPGLAMYHWMAYAGSLRVVGLRDIFHREWND